MPPTGRTNTKKMITILAVIIVLIILLLYMQGAFVSKVSPGLSSQNQQPNPAFSNKAIVIKQQVGNILTWPGTVKSRTVANIAPRMTARIIEIKVNAGSAVKKGDLIARVDEREIKAQEQIALAALSGATAEANRAKADEQRNREL